MDKNVHFLAQLLEGHLESAVIQKFTTSSCSNISWPIAKGKVKNTELPTFGVQINFLRVIAPTDDAVHHKLSFKSTLDNA